MRFFRIFLYGFLIAGIVAGWEFFREEIISCVSFKSCSDKNYIKENEQCEQQKSADSLTDVDPNSVSKKSKQSDRDACATFEKGFADVAKGALQSVVNVATMQIIKEEQPSDIFDGLFGGSPFDEMFKDFFGGMHGERPQKQKKERKATSLGSGFVVNVDRKANKAYVVTNNHVVEKAKKIVVYLADKTELSAEVHATDPRTDIAVLVVDTKPLGADANKLIAIEWGDSDELSEGNWVIAIGNPFNLGSTVTHGIVSSKGRNIALPGGKSSMSFVDDFIQHSAQINIGNSGGCLLDIHGKVIGINNAILAAGGGNIGIGFAIPSNLAKNTVLQLIEHKRTFRGWLGAEVQLITSKQAESVGIKTDNTLDRSKIFGAFIARVVPGGPAEKAGIKRGDIILEFDSKPITAKNSLQKIVGSAKIDSIAKAKVWRQKADGKKWGEVVVDVKVGDFEKAMESGAIDSKDTGDKKSKDSGKETEIPELGISVMKVPERMRSAVPAEFSDSLLVTKVDDTRLAGFFEVLFVPGDLIVSANNTKIQTAEQFKDILNKIKNSRTLRDMPIPFVVLRNGSMVMLATTIDFDLATTLDSEKGKTKEIPLQRK